MVLPFITGLYEFNSTLPHKLATKSALVDSYPSRSLLWLTFLPCHGQDIKFGLLYNNNSTIKCKRIYIVKLYPHSWTESVIWMQRDISDTTSHSATKSVLFGMTDSSLTDPIVVAWPTTPGYVCDRRTMLVNNRKMGRGWNSKSQRWGCPTQPPYRNLTIYLYTIMYVKMGENWWSNAFE